MASVFDPYHKWLGIAPNEQPPNHYRLLGLYVFESDPDVIANAADRQMAHVRTFQTGAQAVASQRILNEIAAAKLCLLRPQRKAEYDAQLKVQLGGDVVPAPSRPTSQLPIGATTLALPSEADLDAPPLTAVPAARDPRMLAILGVVGASAVLVMAMFGAGLVWLFRASPEVASTAPSAASSTVAADPTSKASESPAGNPGAPQPRRPIILPPGPAMTPESPAANTPAPATVAVASAGSDDTQPLRYRWRFRNAEAMDEGSFTANTWRIADIVGLNFRVQDADGVDRSALLKGLRGKTLSVFDGSIAVVKVRVIQVDDLQRTNVGLLFQKLSWLGGSWRNNHDYWIEIDHTYVDPGLPVPVAAPTPIAVFTPGPAAPPVPAPPPFPVGPPAPVAPPFGVAPPGQGAAPFPVPPPSPPVATRRRTVRYDWRFRNFEAMQDGTFTANTWSISGLNTLVFRRQDDSGVSRSTFLMGLRGKTLTLFSRGAVVAQVGVTAADLEGSNVRLSCMPLGNAQGDWKYDQVYTIVAGDVVDDPVPVAAAPANGAFNGRWYWRKFESLRDGAFAADGAKPSETTVLTVRRMDNNDVDRHDELLKLAGEKLNFVRQGATVAKFGVAAVDDTESKEYVKLTVQYLSGSSLSWSGTSIYMMQAE